MSYSRVQLESLGFGSLGSDVCIHENVVFFNAAKIFLGSRVRIDCFCLVSAGEEGVHIGNNVHIAASSMIFGGGGRVTMEDFAGLSSRVTLYTASDDYTGQAMTNPTVPPQFRKVSAGPIVLHRHAIIGASSVIMPNVSIGLAAAVGALSFVSRDVPDHEIVSGVPARRIGTRGKKLLEIEQEYKRLI